MKTALFGGSFNPVHNEHVNIVKAAIAALGFDRVIVIPSHITPAKIGKMTVSDSDRLNMCRLAFGGIDKVEVSAFEQERGGISYTYLTCRAFREKYPADSLYFILGADMLENFPCWKYPDEILKCVTIAVCARESGEGLNGALNAFSKRFGAGKAVVFNYTGAKVSSTRVRVLAALGESTGEYVSEKTANYIEERSLYSIEGISKVKEHLTADRWKHTLKVAFTAAENCARAGVDEKTAITAAALHDCAKYLSSDCDELSGFICPQDVPASVIHQYAGAYVAKRVFGITDEDILGAIKYHTSGKENMSALEKLIFLSDMLEEDRNFDGIEKLREEFSRSIDGALYAALEHQLNYLKSAGKPVYPLTQRAFEYLQGK